MKYSLLQIIRELEKSYKDKADEKGIIFELEVDYSIPDSYIGDEERIRRILNKLVSNAFEHTDFGVIGIHINGERKEEKEVLTIMVSDTGEGISKEKLSKITLDPDITVNSVYGLGSQFIFTVEQEVASLFTMEELRSSLEDEPAENNSEFPYVEGVDWDKALLNMPEKELVITVVSEFCEGAANEIGLVRELKDLLDASQTEETFENYRIKVHALKNSAALIGAMNLSEEARALEYASRDREYLKIDADTENFCSNYLAMAQALSKGFGWNLDTSVKKTIDEKALAAELDKLQTAMDSFDISTLNDTMEDLERYEYSEEVGACIKSLSEAVLTLDKEVFGTAMTKLRTIISA